ncbi:DUF4913 domain-containing protein [Streptomyces sp. NPDC051162]|uniref:DUF4913 domain-containing protein n=1 Tax=Streptomyces sp. NPDC051162 TaxID=3154747 RepID=UPI0034148A5D
MNDSSSGAPTDQGTAPAVLAEDIEDLRATVEALAAQLEDTNRLAENLRDAPPPEPAEPSGEKAQREKKPKPVVPPLILRLDGEVFDQELAGLAVWVEHVLVACYLTEVSSSAPWCARWYEHPQAIARLHALWLAWQELTTPDSGGYTGPSVWHRDHLDPCMTHLRDPHGPFASCMTSDERPQHTVLPQPPVDPLPTFG